MASLVEFPVGFVSQAMGDRLVVLLRLLALQHGQGKKIVLSLLFVSTSGSLHVSMCNFHFFGAGCQNKSSR